MKELRSFPLVLDDGGRAEVLSTSRFLDDSNERVVRLQDGREFLVPRSALETRSDGTYRLRMNLADLEGRGTGPEEVVIPALEEELDIEKQEVETGRVRVHKRVETRNAIAEETLLSREFDIERVPVDRLVSETTEPRYEGDTLILPVFDEVLVVEKRLVLREEIRITRRTHERVEQQSVPLRREHVEVERIN